MNRGFYGGYLVRALNELASLTAQCGAVDVCQEGSMREKASGQAEELQRSQKKTSDSVRRRKHNRNG